jgi:hypothetical protein
MSGVFLGFLVSGCVSDEVGEEGREVGGFSRCIDRRKGSVVRGGRHTCAPQVVTACRMVVPFTSTSPNFNFSFPSSSIPFWILTSKTIPPKQSPLPVDPKTICPLSSGPTSTSHTPSTSSPSIFTPSRGLQPSPTLVMPNLDPAVVPVGEDEDDSSP